MLNFTLVTKKSRKTKLFSFPSLYDKQNLNHVSLELSIFSQNLGEKTPKKNLKKVKIKKLGKIRAWKYCINVDLFKDNLKNKKSRLPWRKMLGVGWVAIFPDSIQCTSELAHICENKNIHCNPKWDRKQEILEEGRRQHWFSRNFLLYTMGQATHSSPSQRARWLASGSPMGPLSSCRDSWTRSLPMPVLLWVTWQPQQPPHFMLLQVVDLCHYILKKSFLTCLSKYQLLKIKRRQTHELRKLAICNSQQI